MKHVFLMHDTKRYHDLAEDICEVMKGLDFEFIYKTSVQAIQKHIKEYQEPVRFYAVGGDGTLNGIIQPLVHTNHELVLIPFGTGNDFHRMLLDEKDPIKVLKESLKYKTQKVDIIALNDQYYVNATCFGVDSIIANHIHDSTKFPLIPQSKSYAAAILKHLVKYQFDEVEIYSEGKCLFKGPTTLCTINNGIYYGGGFPIVPHSKIQDGIFEICVVDRVPYRKVPYLLSLLFQKKLYDRHEVHYFQAKEVIVKSVNSSNMDGEEYKADEYVFKIVPASLNIVIYK